MSDITASFAKACRLADAANGNGHDESEIIQLEIKRMAKLHPVQYDRERELAAQRLGIRISTLDRQVEAERKRSGDDNKQGQALLLPEPEPWPERVDGAELLCALSAAIRQHVVLPEHSADAVALWAVHTYALDAVNITPRLAITSPEKQCGKTTLLDVIRCLAWRPLETANATGPAIFRAVELARPCLLVDEADTFLADNVELRGILNSGHRRGGSVLRTVGDDHEPRQFSTYAACAIAMIGKLPSTLADRSIAIPLQRRLAGESVEPFRLDRVEHLNQLASKATRWAADNLDRVRAAEPDMPPGTFNRVADNWRSLLAIAEVAGGEWPQRARAALASIQATVEDDALRVALLADIRLIFDERKVDRLPSAEIVKVLVAMEGRPWAEMPKTGKALTPTGLARLLKSFHIRPDGIRVGNETPNGYRLEQFTDAFERYLSPTGEIEPPHLHKCDETGTYEGFKPPHGFHDVEVTKCEKSNNDGLCGGVEVRNGGTATSEASARLCDHCGCRASPANPLNPWDWRGRRDGIWLHARCEEAWHDSETGRAMVTDKVDSG